MLAAITDFIQRGVLVIGSFLLNGKGSLSKTKVTDHCGRGLAGFVAFCRRFAAAGGELWHRAGGGNVDVFATDTAAC